MTYKFTTRLQYFKLGDIFIEDALWMEWYIYHPNDEQGPRIAGFDFRQVPGAETWMKDTLNFNNTVSYQTAYVEELPVVAPDHFLESPDVEFPAYLVLGDANGVLQEGMAPATHITLWDESGEVEQAYGLVFPIIGKVLGV